MKEYYILDDRGVETIFYGLNDRGFYDRIEESNGGVIESKLLPGFRFPVSDIYKADI